MTKGEKDTLLKLVDRLWTSQEHAHKAYNRYTCHPGTDTGIKELASYEKWMTVFETTLSSLHKLIMALDHD